MKWKLKNFISLTVPVVVLSGTLPSYADVAPGAEIVILPAMLAGAISLFVIVLTAIGYILIRFIQLNSSWLRNENDFKLIKKQKAL